MPIFYSPTISLTDETSLSSPAECCKLWTNVIKLNSTPDILLNMQ